MNKDYLEFRQTIPDQDASAGFEHSKELLWFHGHALHFWKPQYQQTRGRKICLWYMYKLRGEKRYYVKWIKLKWLTPLFVASPRTKDVERRLCLTNTHTYTSFSSSCHKHLSPQISVCDPHSTVSLPFSLFLWIPTGFEAKAASFPGRFVHLPTDLLASTSNFLVNF